MSSSSYATSPPPGSQDPTVPQEASPTASPQQSQPQTAAAPSSTSSSATTTNDNLYLHNDPARTGFDPAQGWAANYLRILTGRVTDEGIFHYREARSRAHEARDVARAEKHRDWLLAYSPTVRFLNDRIAELNHGQAMGPHNIVCRRCPARLTTTTAGGRPLVERQGGGFDPERGILVCSNSVRNRGHLEDTLAHEMVHAYDHLRWEVDFVGRNSLRQAACAEIRASMLSGECRFLREFWTRSNWRVTEQFQDCVRRRAVSSLLARPWCKDVGHASKTVNEVWDSCFSDTRPFDEVYR